MFKVFLTASNGKRASPIRNERKITTKCGYKARNEKNHSSPSNKWDLTTFKILKNQFHSSKKISNSGYCRVRCDGSLIASGGKIPDVSYIVAKLTTFCLGRSPQMIQCCERNEH